MKNELDLQFALKSHFYRGIILQITYSLFYILESFIAQLFSMKIYLLKMHKNLWSYTVDTQLNSHLILKKKTN